MAADHLQFLKDKFLTDLQEAVEELEELPLPPHFEVAAEVLRRRSMGASTPIAMKNGLYDLRYLLAECVVWAEQERDRKSNSQNRKIKIEMYAWHVKKLWFLHKTGRKLLRTRKELQRMSDDAAAAADQRFSLSDAIRVCSVWDSSWIPPEYASQRYGLADRLQSIKASLCPTPDADDYYADTVKAIAIVGMGGVGKTTLARMFVEDYGSSSNFSPIIWVRISKETTPSQIVRHLLGTLRDLYGANYRPPQMSTDDGDVYPHPLQLREIHDLLSGKKYLIVVDNVCYSDEWYFHLASNIQTDGTTPVNALSRGLPKGSGGAVIVTTRFQDVGRSMVGEKNLLKLKPTYGAEELWSMFMDSIRRKVFLDREHHQTLSRMKDEIVDRCNGLPLAAKTLAEVISFQNGKEGVLVKIQEI